MALTPIASAGPAAPSHSKRPARHNTAPRPTSSAPKPASRPVISHREGTELPTYSVTCGSKTRVLKVGDSRGLKNSVAISFIAEMTKKVRLLASSTKAASCASAWAGAGAAVAGGEAAGGGVSPAARPGWYATRETPLDPPCRTGRLRLPAAGPGLPKVGLPEPGRSIPDPPPGLARGGVIGPASSVNPWSIQPSGASVVTNSFPLPHGFQNAAGQPSTVQATSTLEASTRTMPTAWS